MSTSVLGFSIKPDEARDIAEVGVRITRAANEQLGFIHPENSDWRHISFCQIADPVQMVDGIRRARNAVSIMPGIKGRAFITGTHQHTLDPDGPWPGGHKLSDTRPLIH